MTERVVSLAKLLEETRRLTKETLFSALPASVVSYDPATQRAEVKPQLKFTLRDEFAGKEAIEDLPIICDVPIMFPRFGDFAMTMPVTAGDTVLLVFCDRSIDKWKTNGGNVDPIDLRAHDISDAVAIPGLYPKPEMLPSTLTTGMALGKIGDTTLQIHIGSSSINLGGPGAVEFVALATKTLTELQTLNTWLVSHTHPTGVGPSGPPTVPPPTPNSVAATKVKAL